MKDLKTIQRLLVLTIFMSFCSCKEDTIVNPVAGNPSLISIHGRVDNWTLGDTMTAVAGRWLNLYGLGDSLYVFGTSPINSEGSFNLYLSTAPLEILRGYANGAYHFSDTAAKFVGILGILLRYPNGSYHQKRLHNSTRPFIYSQTIGDYWAYFEYADRDVNMIGTDKGWSTDTIITYHNVHYKKGWNRIVRRAIAKSPHVTYEESVVENVNEGKWYLSW